MVLAFGLVALILYVATASPEAPPRNPALDKAPPQVLPVSDPKALRPVSAVDARRLNDQILMADGPNPAARPFAGALRVPETLTRSLDCLTAAVYYEAANETVDGQRAVAQVVLNRVRHPAFPHSVCGVVFQGSSQRTGCQFTFTCDGSRMRVPAQRKWAQARAVALAALSGSVYAPVGWSTHYHANYVLPYWAPSLTKTATVGAHIFYRWNAGWGDPRAFTAGYSGVEPVIGPPTAVVDVAAATGIDAVAAITPGPPVVPGAERPLLKPGAQVPPAAGAEQAYIPSARRWVLGGVVTPEERAGAAPPANTSGPAE